MRVLNIYRTYFPDPPGGLQEAIRQICLATAQQGVENSIYALSPNSQPSQIQRPEGRVIRSRSWMAPASCDLGGLGSLLSYSKLSKESDVLHYFFPWPFADVLHAAVKPDKPAMMTYISDVVRQRLLGAAYSPLMWRTLKSMQLIVANCPAYAQTSPILSHPSIRDKVRVIPLGIDENSYPTSGDDKIFERINMQASEPYFLFIGVLRYYKGLHSLIKAAKNVNAKIVIAGSGPEGDKLKKLMADLAVNNVVFAGQVSDAEKYSLLTYCRALVLPSHLRSEAYGMVLVEAAMMGKPMISCEIGTGTSFVNAHQKTGIVVSPESPEELTNAMRTLLREDDLTLTMGANARKRYEKLFSGHALGNAYTSVYNELLAS
jgi:glycosyltransferase involved in cell wall biosynthesis